MEAGLQNCILPCWVIRLNSREINLSLNCRISFAGYRTTKNKKHNFQTLQLNICKSHLGRILSLRSILKPMKQFSRTCTCYFKLFISLHVTNKLKMRKILVFKTNAFSVSICCGKIEFISLPRTSRVRRSPISIASAKCLEVARLRKASHPL